MSLCSSLLLDNETKQPNKKWGTTIDIEATDKTDKHNSKLCVFGWSLDRQAEKPPN